ncbi:MAG: glycoside hydrolase family 5 protein [Sphingomicrobium sp.]
MAAVAAAVAASATSASAQLAPVSATQLSPGWNLGNSLESTGSGRTPFTTSQETNWGNPVVNQQIMNGVATAGFKSVRIPVSWMQYADRNNNIAPFWLARVKQVVDYARNAGLYVIINEHWDGGWLQPTSRTARTANPKLKALWTQVGNYFKNYDDHLIFAGTNEVMVDGQYGTPTAENCTAQTGFNQVFVDAVRATGGNNSTRTLIFQGYNTNIDNTITACGAKVPTDPTPGRLMAEFHYYDPWNFAGSETSTIWQWGSIATDPAATETWANEPYVEAQFDKLKANYVDKGIPVIIGEFGAISKTEYDAPMKYRSFWDQYISGSAKRHGIAPIYWDNGYPDNHQFGLFNRTTGAQYYPTTVNAIVTAQ